MESKYDLLSEYHLHNPELKLYSILEEIRSLIEESRTRAVRNNGPKKKEIIEKIQALLTDPAAKRILEMIYRKNNIKFDITPNKDSDGSTSTNFNNLLYKTPSTLLQILFLSAIIDSYAFLSQTLDLDLDEVKAVIEYLKAAFVIDDPLVWLQNFIEKDKRYRNVLKKSILLGHEALGQDTDTAEARKLKKRRKNPRDSIEPSSKI